MPTSAKAPAKSAAQPAPSVRKTRRVFPVGQCHWRAGGLGDKTGPSACKKQIVAKRANLCPEHEKVWQAAARKRYTANKAAKAQPVKKANASGKTELEEQLEASVEAVAFATPELAAKAKADRDARRAPRS
jgi:hypothetical protein